MVGDSNAVPPEGREPQKPSGPQVKAFNCPHCGGTVQVRYPGHALSAVCESCNSIIDVSDENYKILEIAAQKTGHFSPKLELGTRGTLMGKQWEVIGFMVRADVASNFCWHEYLLFNPYEGFRWLTESEGHWNFVKTVKEKPTMEGSPYDFSIRGGEHAIYDNHIFRLYYRGEAEVRYVLGEFYWKVIVGSRVQMSDYVYPPFMLSSEKDASETVWSLSEYLAIDDLLKGFPNAKTHQTYKIGANQPSPSGRLWRKLFVPFGIFVVTLTMLQMFHVVTSQSHVVFDKAYTFITNGKTTDTTSPVFTVGDGMGNLRINFTADVDNSWFFIGGDLVNNQTGEAYSFERACEYYHGMDSDGAWSEGSMNSDILLSRVPQGDYYFNFDTESGDFKQAHMDRAFSIQVARKVPTWSNYMWALFLISFFPASVWFMSRKDEYARWEQSDYNPYKGASSS